VNAAALPAGLLESELFGHERGAFTGAVTSRVGRFELAHRGTLFLDEVGDIPLELQVKLLRVLQEREIERLGSTRTQKVDVRVIAATNRDLARMVADGSFRSDLYYRLSVFPVDVPPLRERADDVPALVGYFVQKFSKSLRRQVTTIPATTMAALQAWPWPGNIRELQNLIERAVILSPGPVLQVPLPEMTPLVPAAFGSPATDRREALDERGPEPSNGTMDAAERDHILRVLRDTGGIVAGPTGAAARLGLKRTTLQSKMRKLGIRRPAF
jgi:formate hydrogenlyase transcriptional activator